MDIMLYADKVRLALRKRLAGKKGGNKKSYEAWKAKGYTNEPQVTVVIESHNKSRQVMHVVKKLRQRPGMEIIVIDDGSQTDHTMRLARGLDGANEYLLRANDLYENIMYDRAIHFAHGEYIVLMQDDDDIDGTAFIDTAIDYFGRHPKLCVLGGCDAMNVTFDDTTRRRLPSNTRPLEKANDTFCFVPAVNRAPMIIRRSLFMQHLHHIDVRLAPFMFDDEELCLRTWLCGLQVGWYDAGFKSLSAGGMRLYNNLFTRQQVERNSPLLYDLYNDKTQDIEQRVREANATLKESVASND